MLHPLALEEGLSTLDCWGKLLPCPRLKTVDISSRTVAVVLSVSNFSDLLTVGILRTGERPVLHCDVRERGEIGGEPTVVVSSAHCKFLKVSCFVDREQGFSSDNKERLLTGGGSTMHCRGAKGEEEEEED